MDNLFSEKGKIIIVDDDILALMNIVAEAEKHGKLKELEELIASLESPKEPNK
jgi:hypothetical protein